MQDRSGSLCGSGAFSGRFVWLPENTPNLPRKRSPAMTPYTRPSFVTRVNYMYQAGLLTRASLRRTAFPDFSSGIWDAQLFPHSGVTVRAFHSTFLFFRSCDRTPEYIWKYRNRTAVPHRTIDPAFAFNRIFIVTYTVNLSTKISLPAPENRAVRGWQTVIFGICW